MAIGDSWNDRGMLLWAGMGIAMANGEAGIRRIADWVTTRMHHEDGVAEAIDRFILNPGSHQPWADPDKAYAAGTIAPKADQDGV